MGRVQVRIGGINYEGWESVSVLRNLEAAASSFACTMAEKTTELPIEPWSFPPGVPCSIWLDGTLVLTGFVDAYQPRFSATSHGVELRGRSKTADFVDCAALVAGGQFKALSIWDIATRLAQPFGLTVTSTPGSLPEMVDQPRPSPDFVGPMPQVPASSVIEGPRPSPDFIGPMPPIQDVQIQQGETAHAVLERLARMQGLLVTDTAAGNLALTRVGERVAITALVQGQNILGGSATLDVSERYSEYTVKGQRANIDDRKDQQQSGGSLLPVATNGSGATNGAKGEPAGPSIRATIGRVTDSFLGRYRPWLLTAETQADDAMCGLRALWEAQRRSGHSLRASIVVAGWRQLGPEDRAGPLWDVNLLVPVMSSFLGINRLLLVSTVEFRKDAGGTTTRLELTLPDAYAAPEQKFPVGTASGATATPANQLWAGGTIGPAEKLMMKGGLFV
jgi:prophage tail gpP-like protein